MAIHDRRVQYETAGLDTPDLDSNGIVQLQKWYREAEDAGATEPNAITITTLDETGHPDSRTVLARNIENDGRTFYSNRLSAKGTEIAGDQRGSGVFSWLELHRQVRIRGTYSVANDTVSDTYFASRPRESQIGAWASPQSQPITNRAELERLVTEVTARFEGKEVTRPPHWGGYVLSIDTLEFWQGRPSRLHDRFRYSRSETGWTIERLAP